MKNSNSIEWDIYVNMNLLSAVFGHMHLFRVTTSIALHLHLVYPTFSDISIIIYFSSPHLSFFFGVYLSYLVSLFNPFLCLRHSTFRFQKFICCIRHIQVIFISLLQYDFFKTHWPWCYSFVSLFSLHISCFGKLSKKAT